MANLRLRLVVNQLIESCQLSVPFTGICRVGLILRQRDGVCPVNLAEAWQAADRLAHPSQLLRDKKRSSTQKIMRIWYVNCQLVALVSVVLGQCRWTLPCFLTIGQQILRVRLNNRHHCHGVVGLIAWKFNLLVFGGTRSAEQVCARR